MRARRTTTGLVIALLVLTVATSGCAWVALGFSSATYRTTKSGESANVVVSGSTAYGTLADRGLEIVDLNHGQRRTIPPPAGSESVDDLAVADGFLFALDARKPGHLSVFSLTDPEKP